MDPARFECIMNKTALRQEPVDRMYMQALPYYNGEEQAEETRFNSQSLVPPSGLA